MGLTQRAVDRATEPGMLHDDKPRGLSLRVSESGRKTYELRYRLHGHRRQTTIGTTDAWSLAEARERARECLRFVDQGKNPAHAKSLAGTTIDEVVADYIESKRRSLKPATLLTYHNAAKHIRTHIGSMPINEARYADVLRLKNKMADNKGAANIALSLLSSVFTFAERQEIVNRNPARLVERYKMEPRKRRLTSTEVASIIGVVSQWEDWRVADIIKLLILTGCRKNEIRNLRWDDWHGDRLELRDSKSGSKTVYLSAAARQVLEDRYSTAFMGYGADADESRKPIFGTVTLHRPWKRICELAGVDDVRIHDLRHFYAETAAGAGLSLPLVGALLGHKGTSNTQRYAEVQAEPQQMAAERVGYKLQEVI